MIIKLIQDWQNVDDTYKVGTKLEVPDETGQSLIEQEIAEKIQPKAGKCIVVKEIEQHDDDDDGKKAEQQIAELVDKRFDEKFADTEKRLRLVHQDEQTKTGGFGSFGDFLRSIVASGVESRPDQKMVTYLDHYKVTGMGEVINADGGFLIPPEFSTALLTAMAQAGVLAPKTFNIPVSGNSMTLPFVNLTTQASSWTGGITVYKPAESVAKTASSPKFAQANLKLNKMTGLIYTTDELLADSAIALETFLTVLTSTEFALTKDEDIINGSGAGECLGIMNAPATITVAIEPGQAATTIVFENVLKMWMRLNAPSAKNAVWLINRDCMEQIMKLSIAVGTGGSSVIVVNATTQLPQTLFGAPIIWSPHCQTLGTAGDIILADFSQYVTITKAGAAGIETATSIHVKFAEDETAFRFVVRFDGQPWWASAVTPKHGSSTVSPFVSLAVRS
ncbi:hypothetical protein LCGC14_0421360 [marine sediment metagenome]|uniref:Phage capsid-like C-terminal domain-containing protein n=1 Tax=marine sediment metagenome TaxID=412755 RepID=A0A0F9SWY3_9ZZZZ